MTLTARPDAQSGTGRHRIQLRSDPQGAPLVSGTFVLSRSPAPDERLRPLVTSGTVSLDLELVLAEDAAGPGTGARVASTTFEVRRASEVLASITVDGPFAHGAVQVSVLQDAAADLLEAMLGGCPDVTLFVRAVLSSAAARPETRVRVDLGALWERLGAVADDTREFLEVDLLNYLSVLRADGVVAVEDGPDARAPVLAATLAATRFVLRPVAGREAPTYRLSDQDPGRLTGVGTVTGAVEDVGTVELGVGLGELLAARIGDAPARHVHVVSPDGGLLTDLPPVRSPRRSLGPQATVGMAERGRVVPLASVLRPTQVSSLAFAPLPAAVLDRPQVVALDVTGATGAGTSRRPGPVVDRLDAPLWKDRWSDSSWYLPSYRLLVPEAPLAGDEQQFAFELEPDLGHRLDGTAGLSATITVTLEAGRSAEVEAAWQAAGEPRLEAVPLTEVSVHLAIPFRDEDGSARVEHVPADELRREGPLGAEGSRLVARFRLLDAWARMAYGALSTPGFQAAPAAIVVRVAHEGWRESRPPATLLVTGKRWALTGTTTTRGSRAGRITLPAVHATPLVTAHVQPAWQLRPDLLDRLRRPAYAWSTFASTTSLTALVPCSSHGELYRERRDDEWIELGCRPALQLGSTEYRTYEEIEVDAARGAARVYRSLRRPGRFLVMPGRYAIGRYGPKENDRPYVPRVLLHSTIDVDDPTNIRCVLAASLEPDLPPYRRARILAELRRTAHTDPVLEYLPDTGVEPQVAWAVPDGIDVQCVAVESGFDLVCTTDVAGFLTLKSMIERTGVRGTATVSLPGGVRASSALLLDLAAVTGPFETGPVEVERRAGATVLTNRCGQTTLVESLAVAGETLAAVDEVLAPGGSTECPVDASADVDVVYRHDHQAERLEEVRAYIEDLDVGVLFVAAADPADAGLAGLEISTALFGREDDESLLLTSAVREAERSYVMPLTAFATDPVLEFTVTAVATDGTRRSGPPTAWRLRTQGALVPVGPPL